MKHRFFLLHLVAALVCTQFSLVLGVEPGKIPSSPSDILSPKGLLGILPRDIPRDIQPGSRNRDEALKEASARLDQYLKGRSVKVVVEVSEIRSEVPLRISSAPDKVRVGGADIWFSISVSFPEGANGGKLKKGNKITVEGMAFATFNKYEYKVPYKFELRERTECRLHMLDAKLTN